MTFAEYTEKSKKREKQQEALVCDHLDKSDKAAKFLEEKLAKCNTKAVSMLCPTEMLEELDLNSTKAGACVSTLADECFVRLDGAVNKTLMLASRRTASSTQHVRPIAARRDDGPMQTSPGCKVKCCG
jgi:hypothetical protein